MLAGVEAFLSKEGTMRSFKSVVVAVAGFGLWGAAVQAAPLRMAIEAPAIVPEYVTASATVWPRASTTPRSPAWA